MGAAGGRRRRAGAWRRPLTLAAAREHVAGRCPRAAAPRELRACSDALPLLAVRQARPGGAYARGRWHRTEDGDPMATAAAVARGARPRTLPAAVAPVLVGTGAAAAVDGFVPARALLALVVALALQVGVNYANDYSDGIRGTDDDRVGPLRLAGSGWPRRRRCSARRSPRSRVAALAGLALAR